MTGIPSMGPNFWLLGTAQETLCPRGEQEPREARPRLGEGREEVALSNHPGPRAARENANPIATETSEGARSLLPIANRFPQFL